MRRLRRALSGALAGMSLLIGACGGGGTDSGIPPGMPAASAVVPPLPLPGPFAVACSNILQDFSRLAPGDDATAYWEGTPTAGGAPRYLNSLLADPANTLSVTVNAPNDSNLFGSFAGMAVPFVLLSCYPTTAINTRADYLLPNGALVPHMQTGAELPLFASASERYPLLLFSHGYSGSPLSSAYPAVMSMLASYGYVVVAPFHGDPRFSDLSVDNLSDAVRVLSSLPNFVALQSLRPLSMSAALDLMLAHPQWRDHIDPNKIGGFGASMGGESMLLMGGAKLTTSLGLASTRVTLDARLKAAVGYVPYFGQPFLPAFGSSQQGIDGVTLPYLAIAGTADTTAPLVMTQQGINRLVDTRELVALQGVRHTFDVASSNDIFTWSLTFFDAMVKGNLAAQQRLSTMASVAGGGDDRVATNYNGPR